MFHRGYSTVGLICSLSGRYSVLMEQMGTSEKHNYHAGGGLSAGSGMSERATRHVCSAPSWVWSIWTRAESFK